ncbi:MAG: ROK family glucokinase [Frankiaceae bacterium]
MSRPLAVGVDIGGTKLAAGVVDGQGRIVDRLLRDTPDKALRPVVVEDTVAELVAELASRHDVRAVGVGAAGFVDAARGAVLFAPHLAWREEPLRDALARRTGLPVVVENDANAAAWAEWRFGAARGADQFACVTLGTGIGGALVLDGALRRGASGVAGEFGHMQVVPDGLPCPCGNCGCWEQYCSGSALRRLARELLVADPAAAAGLLARAGGDPELLTGPLLVAAAGDGDPAALRVVAEVGRWLGVGLANLAAVLDPALLVIGGGVGEAGELLLGPARAAFRARLVGRGHRPEARIAPAALGNAAGLIGAADLAAASAG